MELTQGNYRSPEMEREFLSVSQWKGWLECPARQWAKISGDYAKAVAGKLIPEESNDALLLGSYVDCALLTPDLFGPWYDKHRGELELKKGGFNEIAKTAQRMIARANRDPFFMDTISGTNQQILTAEIDGVKWKMMLDSIGDGAFTDLKTCRDFARQWCDRRGKKLAWWEIHDYPLQLRVYQEGILQRYNEGKWFPHLSAITKQNPPRLGVWAFDNQQLLDERLEEVLRLQPQVLGWKQSKTIPEGCGDCEWCRAMTECQVFKV